MKYYAFLNEEKNLESVKNAAEAIIDIAENIQVKKTRNSGFAVLLFESDLSISEIKTLLCKGDWIIEERL
jgi:hypothetical protein